MDRQSREMKNLGPVNRPGLSELAPLKPTKRRSPIYQKARTIYEEALNAIQKELDAFQNSVKHLIRNCTGYRDSETKYKTKDERNCLDFGI